MNIPKIGDKVWFFFTDLGRRAWHDDATLVYPNVLDITSGTVVFFKEFRDEIHLYIDGCNEIATIGIDYLDDEWVFCSKEEAINAMIRRLDGLR